MSLKNAVSIFLVWMVLAVILAAIGVVALDWREYRLLARNGVEAIGQVTAKEPQNHQFVRYTFQVNDRTYAGIGSAGQGNPEFDQLKIGDAVKVFYNPSDPNESFLGNPKTQFDSATSGVLFLALAGSALLSSAYITKGGCLWPTNA